VDTWVAAGQGLSRCLTHPGDPFAPHIGCSTCNASTDTGPEDVESAGEGETQCAEAERRGLPDAFEVEARMWSVWRTATRRAETAAAIADKLSHFRPEETRSDEDEEGRPADLFPFDLDLAAKFEAVAAKWMDVSVKAGKLATGPVLHRERMAELERRARLVKGKAH
jgi:hypothetical protein